MLKAMTNSFGDLYVTCRPEYDEKILKVRGVSGIGGRVSAGSLEGTVIVYLKYGADPEEVAQRIRNLR